MTIADELRKLQELHEAGSLTDAEFAAAKAKVLSSQAAGSGAGTDPAMKRHLKDIKRHNDVEQLDRQWALERDQYMVAGNYGVRHLPSKGMSVLGGVVIAVFGIFWTAMAANMGGGASFFPLFGLLFVAVGVGMSIYSFTKASQYEEAHARYRRRRAELLGEDRVDENRVGEDREPEAGFSDERIKE
jgi:hypothetical protein